MRTKWLILLVFLIGCAGFAPSHASAAGYQEKVKDGWLFYHERFITAAQAPSGDVPIVQLPNRWQEVEGGWEGRDERQ